MTLQFDVDKILLVKLETTYGTDPTPVGGNGFWAKDLKIMPMEGTDIDRGLDLPYFGSSGTIPVDLHSKITFDVELAPSGTSGTAPAWGPALRACGCAETIVNATSVAYNPISRGHESATIYVWIDTTLYAILGARGTAKFDYKSSGVPYIRFELTGLFTTPTDTARVTPTLSGFQKPLAVSDANTPIFSIGGTDMAMRSCMLDLGNSVEARFLVNSEGVLITDAQATLSATVEATTMAEFNPYAVAAAQSDLAISLVHGLGAGNITTLAVPKAQIQRPAGLESAQGVVEWPLSFMPKPTAGNDQWTLTLT